MARLGWFEVELALWSVVEGQNLFRRVEKRLGRLARIFGKAVQ